MVNSSYFVHLITKAFDLWLQIQEIVTTGKLSKLEHFETDEKVLERFSVNLRFQYSAANLKFEFFFLLNSCSSRCFLFWKCKETDSLMIYVCVCKGNALFYQILRL